MNWRGFWKVLWRWLVGWSIGFGMYLINHKLELVSMIWILFVAWHVIGMAQELETADMIRTKV